MMNLEEINSLHVILRTSINRSIQPWKRIVDVSREELVFKCVKSLVDAINYVDFPEFDLKFTVLDDGSSEENLNVLKKILGYCNERVKVDLISLENDKKFKKSYNYSALRQYEIAKESNSLVYMVEDDYFHSIHSIKSMISGWFNFQSRVDVLDAAIYPYDSPHLYTNNNAYDTISRLFFFDGKYWRTCTKSAVTLFVHSSVLEKYWHLFYKFATEFPSVLEDDTINRMYNNSVNVSGPVSLFTPIPSLAIHVSYDNPVWVDPSFFNWRQDFNNLKY